MQQKIPLTKNNNQDVDYQKKLDIIENKDDTHKAFN